jgi:hypothetical protein
MPNPNNDFILFDFGRRLNPALLDFLLNSPRYQPTPLPPADWTGEIVRPDDLIYLSVAAYNLRPVDLPGGTRLERIDEHQSALLVFELPPQTIAEQAFFEQSEIKPDDRPRPPSPPGALPEKIKNTEQLTPGTTAKARISRPSRLVFRLRDDVRRLPLTFEGLLNWDLLEPVLAPLAMLPREPSPDQLRAAPGVAEPTPLQTSIEIPYRLMLSPDGDARWIHSLQPVTHGGRTELWHSRLGTQDTQGVFLEASAINTIPLRAIWSPDFHPLAAHDKMADDPDLGTSAMTPNDRHQIVALTSDYANFRRFQVPPVRPTPIEADQLMLSALGGWLRSRGHWDLPENTGGVAQQARGRFLAGRELRLPVAGPVALRQGFGRLLEEEGVFMRAPDDDLDLTEWVHVGTQGRDHYVRLVYDGCLFPLGHRASLVKITERRFEEVDGAPVALLRQFVYVTVREPIREYQRGNYRNKGREMPLTRVQIKTLITPHLMQPATDLVGNSSFWMLDLATGRDVPFELIGFDAGGRSVPFSMPLIFVRRGEANMHEVGRRWRTDPQPGGSGPRRRAAVNVAAMDFAPGGPAGNGSVMPARAFYFDVTGDGGCGDFLPTLFKADVTLSSVEQLVGIGATTTISYFEDYLNKDFDAHVGLFARIEKDISEKHAQGSVGLAFSAEQAGGIATPNVQLTGLSTKQGPLAGDLGDAVTNTFDPKKFFGGLPGGQTPLLFGAFSLSDILDIGSLNTDAPSIDTHIINDPVRGQLSVVHYAWETTPIRWPAPPSGGLVSFQPSDASRLKIDSRLETALAGGGSQSQMTGELVDFRVEFFKAVTLHFDTFTFSSISGEKLDVNVDLNPTDPIVFGGDLDFVRKLSELIPPGVFGDGPSVDVRPDRVALGFNIGLPPLTVGVFTMKNLGLNAGLELLFADGRPVLDFGFSRRENPFLLTVSLLGGGGFFHLQLDTSGLKLVEAALEFGASVDMNIGVASGNVHVFAGIYFKLEKRDGDLQVVLAGYLRLGGALSVLGLVTISVEFNLSFIYDSGTKKVTGRATLTVNVEVAFFSKSVELSVERSFGRDGGDPSFGDLIHTPAVWAEYADAFA